MFVFIKDPLVKSVGMVSSSSTNIANNNDDEDEDDDNDNNDVDEDDPLIKLLQGHSLLQQHTKATFHKYQSRYLIERSRKWQKCRRRRRHVPLKRNHKFAKSLLCANDVF